jgi:hypothetical protein
MRAVPSATWTGPCGSSYGEAPEDLGTEGTGLAEPIRWQAMDRERGRVHGSCGTSSFMTAMGDNVMWHDDNLKEQKVSANMTSVPVT